MQFVYLAAVDMDCDGPQTTLWEVSIPNEFQGELAHRVAFEKITQSYFGLSDTFVVSRRERDLMIGTGSDLKSYEAGVWQVSVRGNAFNNLYR